MQNTIKSERLIPVLTGNSLATMDFFNNRAVNPRTHGEQRIVDQMGGDEYG